MQGSIPHYDQYAGLWLCEETTFSLLAEKVRNLDVLAHMQSEIAVRARSASLDMADELIEVQGGTGVLNLQGVLMKHVSSMFGGTSTVLARRALKSLLTNESVEKIVLRIESPGGTASGTQQLADDIREAAKQKEVVAHIEDLGASAAYWLASQASKIFANGPAKVGSIGTYMVVTDTSVMAEKAGVKVQVVKAGDFKAAGVPGTEITAKQISEVQRLVDGTNEFFLKAVSEGRGLSLEQVRKLADGRVHFASEAKDLGLIDGVQPFEMTFNSSINPARSPRMTVENNTASVKDIKSNCPGISAEKVLEFAEAGLSLQECKDSYLSDLIDDVKGLQEENAKLRGELAETKAAADAAAQSSLGVDELEHSEGSGENHDSHTEQFQALVKELTDKGMAKAKATSSVVRKNPDLHKAMIAEANG